MTKNSFVEAIKLCYDINSSNGGGDDKLATYDEGSQGSHSSITLAVASGLPQYFSMLFMQLCDPDTVAEEERRVTGDTMASLIGVLSLAQPKRFDAWYTYPQFCSAILDQFNHTYLNAPSFQLRLPTMETHFDNLMQSNSDWQWKTLEALNERYVTNKLAEQINLDLYDIEIENLTRTVEYKNAENDVLKTFCRNLCTHIRRMDSKCLALQVKLRRSDEANSSSLSSQDSANATGSSSPSSSSSTRSKQRSKSAKRWQKTRFVQQMQTISTKMSTLRRTLSDATPFVRRLEEFFATKVAENFSSKKEKPSNPNNVSTADDSGWLSDEDMQFSEAMTTSGASDLFVQTAPVEQRASPPRTPLEEHRQHHSVPVAVADDDISSTSDDDISSILSKKLPQYSSAFLREGKNISSVECHVEPEPVTEDELDNNEEEVLLLDDGVVDEGDTTTRELKSKLFQISQRLNEAEKKLHRVLKQTA